MASLSSAEEDRIVDESRRAVRSRLLASGAKDVIKRHLKNKLTSSGWTMMVAKKARQSLREEEDRQLHLDGSYLSSLPDQEQALIAKTVEVVMNDALALVNDDIKVELLDIIKQIVDGGEDEGAVMGGGDMRDSHI